eukprot:PhF_6_TR24957/c1_g1_i1/m.34344
MEDAVPLSQITFGRHIISPTPPKHISVGPLNCTPNRSSLNVTSNPTPRRPFPLNTETASITSSSESMANDGAGYFNAHVTPDRRATSYSYDTHSEETSSIRSHVSSSSSKGFHILADHIQRLEKMRDDTERQLLERKSSRKTRTTDPRTEPKERKNPKSPQDVPPTEEKQMFTTSQAKYHDGKDSAQYDETDLMLVGLIEDLYKQNKDLARHLKTHKAELEKKTSQLHRMQNVQMSARKVLTEIADFQLS